MSGQNEDIVDSPSDWVGEHIRRYVNTDGEDGHIWKKGSTTLLLTTKGRKSGKWRRTALIYGKDGDATIIVASRGGNSNHPAWYLNLDTNPEVQVQIKGDVFKAKARTVTTEEKPRLWEIMTGIWSDYDDYQKKTDRDIPVVVLERI